MSSDIYNSGKTNRNQYEELLSSMKKYPDISTGFTKRAPHELQEIWAEIQIKLNALGPPRKDISAWKKVWTDWKAYVKKKLSANKKGLFGTGGGPFKETKLSEIEEELANLINLKSTTEGVRSIAFDSPLAATTSSTQQNETTQNENEEPPQNENEPVPKKKKLPAIDLLEKQTISQENFHKQMEMGVRRLFKSSEQLGDTTKKVLNEMVRHNAKMESLLEQKLTLKQRLLEIEIAKLDA